MKKFVLFSFLSLTNIGHATLPQTAFSYGAMLAWAKQSILASAKKDHSPAEINDALKKYPVILEEQCGDLSLSFIQNTPACGTVNCDYLVFRKDKKQLYYYVGHVMFSAKRLFCYPNSHHYYLVREQRESNAASLFSLDLLTNGKIAHQMNKEIDYTDQKQSQFADGLWEKPVDEKTLLSGFKK